MAKATDALLRSAAIAFDREVQEELDVSESIPYVCMDCIEKLIKAALKAVPGWWACW